MQTINHLAHRCRGQAAAFAAFLYRLVMFVPETIKDTRLAFHASAKIRRFWMAHFRKGYINRQLLARKGECRQCGTCCNLLNVCPMLTRQGKCLIYGSCRPRACRYFPIDQKDIDEVSLCGGNCGYRFENDVAAGSQEPL
jgi:hypothetical protein